jgi:hypothetical protein
VSWSGGYAEWTDGDTAYLSIAFTWLLDRAYAQALWYRGLGYKVRVGGPALFLVKMQHELSDLDGVEIGGDYPEAVTKHNPDGTFFSRGCDQGCGFCIVPAMEGRTFTLIPDAIPRPVLCDNNLSGLPADFQDHIISRYQAAGVTLRDANSGFEPHSFTPEVYARWKPLVNAGGGPWRFAFDDMQERQQVLQVMRMLADEPAKRKRVYVLIGNEPFAECMQRIREVIEHGCEPHVQPEIKLSSHERRPWVKHSCGWDQEAERRGIKPGPSVRKVGGTAGEQLLADVARWANGWAWRRAGFDEYDRTMTNKKKAVEFYDTEQGLFTFAEAA